MASPQSVSLEELLDDVLAQLRRWEDYSKNPGTANLVPGSSADRHLLACRNNKNVSVLTILLGAARDIRWVSQVHDAQEHAEVDGKVGVQGIVTDTIRQIESLIEFVAGRQVGQRAVALEIDRHQRLHPGHPDRAAIALLTAAVRSIRRVSNVVETPSPISFIGLQSGEAQAANR